MEMCRNQSGGRPPRTTGQRGFTLVSMAISFSLAGVLIAGAWVAYSGMQVQWKVAQADRIMDQYAAAAMQEMTNTLSWAWGGESIQGASHWKFKIDDVVKENGQLRNGLYQHFIDPQGFITMRYRPTEGLLISNDRPDWVGGRGAQQYRWFGSRPQRGQIRTLDHRDRMTTEGLQFNHNPFQIFQEVDQTDRINRRGVLKAQMTLHYRYSAPGWLKMGTHLYGDAYVRERTYKTQISLRNWDAEGNPYRDTILGRIPGSPGTS